MAVELKNTKIKFMIDKKHGLKFFVSLSCTTVFTWIQIVSTINICFNKRSQGLCTFANWSTLAKQSSWTLGKLQYVYIVWVMYLDSAHISFVLFSGKTMERFAFSQGSTSKTCYAIGCPNSDQKLIRWRAERCEEHAVPHYSELCSCSEPFR